MRSIHIVIIILFFKFKLGIIILNFILLIENQCYRLFVDYAF
jgi:hypothetical protein